LKQRVQHPKVHERKDRGSFYWFFRYRHDELLSNGSVRTQRKFHTIGPSRGEGANGKKQSEIERDKFLAELNVAGTRCEAAVAAQQPVEIGAILFGKLAELWRRIMLKTRWSSLQRLPARSTLCGSIHTFCRGGKMRGSRTLRTVKRSLTGSSKNARLGT
jgi:hypothetical protein